MNPIDKFVSYFSPGSGLKRHRDRMMLSELNKHQAFARDAARPSKHRVITDHILSHADSWSNTRDRIQLIKEVRDLEENEPLIKSILRKFGTYTVGRLQYRARTGNAASDAAINAYVERWMAHADRTGRMHFRAMARLGVTSMKRDGDIGFIISKVRRSDQDASDRICPLRLQAIEADRIGGTLAIVEEKTPKPFRKLKKGEQVFSGVVANDEGVPQRYLIYNREGRTSSMRPWDDIDAQDFILLHDPTRFDAYRGFSAFDAAVTAIKDMKEILGFERIGVKVLTSFSGIVNNAHGEPPDDVSLGAEEENESGGYISKLEPGTIRYLQQNETFQAMKADRPSPTFAGFLETLIRFTGMTVNLPFGVCYAWTGTGPAVRMEAAVASREFEQTQQILEEQFLNPVVRRIIAEGIKIGDLPPVENFDIGEWRYPAKVTIDVGRESKAMIEENMAGLVSKTQIAMDRGEDPDMIRGFIKSEAEARIKDAKELVEASGGELPFMNALAMIERRFAAAPVMPTPQEADSSDASDPSEGDESEEEEEDEEEDDDDEDESTNEMQRFAHPPAPLTLNLQADIKTTGKKRSIVFNRDHNGELTSAEIQEEE